MTILQGWFQRFTIHNADIPKSPWGGGGSGNNDKGGGGSTGGSGDSSGGGKEGPRNPWSTPPSGRPRGAGPSALDEFLRRARGGGGGGLGGGRPHIPGTPSPRALWMLGIGVVVLLWLGLTSIYQIAPQQRGVVTIFGRYAGTLDTGIHMTFPAPIADVTKVDVQNIQTENFPDPAAPNLMITGDQNILDLAFSVRWNINNPADYVFQIAEPKATVRATAESAMREVVANMNLDQAMGAGRSRIETEVQERMQRILDDYKSGILVQGVAIKQAVPPQEVNDAFKDVTAAQQDAVAARNNAQGYAQQLKAGAEGEVAQFDKIYSQYKLAPEVTKRRMYYETMEAVLAKTDKTIVETPGVMPYLPLSQSKKLAEPDITVNGNAK
ncbi:MAG: FtsH protease activity modulator HflK [Sphingomonas sp.]